MKMNKLNSLIVTCVVVVSSFSLAIGLDTTGKEAGKVIDSVKNCQRQLVEAVTTDQMAAGIVTGYVLAVSAHTGKQLTLPQAAFEICHYMQKSDPTRFENQFGNKS